MLLGCLSCTCDVSTHSCSKYLFIQRMRLWRYKTKLVSVIFSLFLTYAVINYSLKGLSKGSEVLTLSTHQNDKGSPSTGYLSVDVWADICGHDMQSLKEFPLFPHGPSTRLRTSSLQLYFRPEFENVGVRIFGFLSPSESGSYSFHLDTSSGTSELWISSDSKPENSKLIANTTAQLAWQYHRNSIPLLAGKRYYLEILLKYGKYEGSPKLRHIYVKWKSSSWRENELREIPSDVFIAYYNNSNRFQRIRTPDHDTRTRVVLPMHIKHKDPSFVNDEVQRRAEMYRLPFISESDSQDLFPPCRYNPSYLVKRPLKRYEGQWEMHYTSIYPFDYSDVVTKTTERVGDVVHFGNDQMDEKTAKAVVSQVWTEIKKKHPRKFSLLRTLNVEENHDQGTGDRYLVELELKEISSGKSERFSEYVYRHQGAQKLCTPVGVAWNKSAVINLLLTTGNNQGRWILHFLDNMAKIYNRTKDANFNVIIVDFDSKDIDLDNALKKTAIPSYQYANIKEKFRKVVGLQQAASMVKDPNSIVFVMDLHIDIPYHFLDDVRKHIIQHKIAYSPLLVRLACGATANQPLGKWEVYGTGLMGMYKSDWDKIGGMNVKEFKDKWGGEDWEIVDRMMEAGMEVERLKMLHLVHYFHSKKGMWNDINRPADTSSNFGINLYSNSVLVFNFCFFIVLIHMYA